MKFFFDRNLSRRLARMTDILETEHTIRHHDDDPRFDHKTPDVVWISELASDDSEWIVISGDAAILKNNVERQALSEANLSFFCLAKPWMFMDIYELVWKFFRVWPDVVKNADVTKPRIYEISGGRALKVELRGETQMSPRKRK